MIDLYGKSKRTHYCTELNDSSVGANAAVAGWVARRRDLGSLIFIDLRDRSGILQLAFDENTDKNVFEKALSARSEYVIFAEGVVRERSSKNAVLPTGNIELYVKSFKIISVSETPPFEIVEKSKVNEELRLKYRYLDLRRPDLQQNILFRHKISMAVRNYFDSCGFIEIETPMLIKSTPEGARDYLVPSRIHRGEFYALPQSPQLYKQLSMVAGFDRYYQLARCFRDEDLRADRQPEFTQIDFEMSFVNEEDIYEISEKLICAIFEKVMGTKIETPFPRFTYRECMDRFGSDKPDTRYHAEIVDLTKSVLQCGFSVFEWAAQNGGAVCGITFKNSADKFTRKILDKLADYAKGCGAAGLAWIKRADNETNCSFSKFVSVEIQNKIMQSLNCENGDTSFIISGGEREKVLSHLGMLRIETANTLEIEKTGFNFLWVTEMPFFEYDAENDNFVAKHHPFTAPLDECVSYLETDKGRVRAKAYDLVLNGIELSSGSIRIIDPVLQKKVFSLLGLSDEEAAAKFGFLTEAFKYGPPPHGGMALGLDRLVMQLLGVETLREVTAFPKIQNASEIMTDCPSAVTENILEDLSIKIIK